MHMTTRRLSRILAAIGFALSVTSGALRAQEPPRTVAFPCPTPVMTLDSIIHRVEEVAAGRTLLRQGNPEVAMLHAIELPFMEEGPNTCRQLMDGLAEGGVLTGLLRYGASHDDARIGSYLLRIGGHIAYNNAARFGWSPTAFLFETVRIGENPGARWQALLHLLRRAEDPSIRGRLVALIRSPVGPPGWENLPDEVIDHLQYMPGEGPRLVDTEVMGSPERLQNPRARWLVQCGRGHPIPRPPGDPCLPGRAPPRIPPGG